MEKPLVILTGASSGIGAGIATLFSKEGYSLGLFARHLDALEKLNLPNSICQAVDVTDLDAFKKALIKAENNFGPVDCLINNAGFGVSGEFTEHTHTEHEKMININFLGVVNCIESILPDMQKRKSGTIINISSIADRVARPKLVTYAATKAAIKSLSESLRSANAKFGIRVCNVAPGKVLTPLLIQANLNDDKTIGTESIAKTVLWIYEQPQNICIRDIVIANTYYEA